MGGVLERLSGRMRVMEWLVVMRGLSGWAMAVEMMGGGVEACVGVLVVAVVVWMTLGLAVGGVAWRWCGWNLWWGGVWRRVVGWRRWWWRA